MMLVLGLSSFKRFFGDTSNLLVLWNSLKLALISTTICFAIGYPFAYLIAGAKPKKQALLILLVTAPMWVNMLLRVYAWRQIFDYEGAINKLILALGGTQIDFLASNVAAIIGMVYVYIPFMIIPIYTVLMKIDRSLLEAGQDLGANSKQIFRKIIFPLSIPGILSGITMVLLPTATTLVIPEYLSNNNYSLIGNVIERKFKIDGDWGFGSAISIVLALIIMLLVYFANKLDRFAEIEEGGKK
jgi:spermidine/putrescine transport system permease protein